MIIENNCTECKFCAEGKKLNKGKWERFHVCTCFLIESKELLYLDDPKHDICENWTSGRLNPDVVSREQFNHLYESKMELQKMLEDVVGEEEPWAEVHLIDGTVKYYCGHCGNYNGMRKTPFCSRCGRRGK